MTEYPEKLAELLDDLSFITTRNDRIEYLIDLADRFDAVRVPEDIATKPYSEANHVQRCESDAYVWAIDQADGTQKYYFDVLNPQGLSAMAMGVILDETLSGQPPEEVAKVSSEIVFKIFGKEVSMGKGQGLMGMVNRVVAIAKSKLK